MCGAALYSGLTSEKQLSGYSCDPSSPQMASVREELEANLRDVEHDLRATQDPEETHKWRAERRKLQTELRKLQRPTGPRKLTLAGLLLVALPSMYYSHALSTTQTKSGYAAKPAQVLEWASFATDVATFHATLDDADEIYTTLATRTNLPGRLRNVMQSEESVRSYIEQYVCRPLEDVPTPAPYSAHLFAQHTMWRG
ncbi:hypothetical protein WJX72_005416 [[Myrmecia] bisecta]|uniref:Uncharacterized protein n=1 Tax=[Myrmecia] bisecta TaxID=41462 RepID=A0AAW1R6J2_9CHLO